MTGHHVATYGDYHEIIMGATFCLVGTFAGAAAGFMAPFAVPASAVGVAAYCYTRATTTRREEDH